MNEGHAALLALELFDEELKPTLDKRDEAIERVKRMCVFITHTPVPAGRDQFFLGVAERVLTADQLEALRASECCNAILNMTFVRLHLSCYVNGVDQKT